MEILGKRSRLRMGAAALVLICLSGCTTPAAAGGVATSSASRVPASLADATATAQAADRLGFDLYALLKNDQDNVVLSPTSIATTLSMAADGARGETASEMQSVMHMSAALATGNGMNSLDQTLGDLGREVTFHSVNAPFAQAGLELDQAYVDRLASAYGAGLHLEDFAGQPQVACKDVNAWISQETQNRIPRMLDQVEASTRLMLVNATYLKATWFFPFSTQDTHLAPFHLRDGSVEQVQTMWQGETFGYAEGAGWQAVELPYTSERLAMTIVVPADLEAFESSFDYQAFDSIVKAISPRPVDISLPRFGAKTALDLASTLQSLGMRLAMDPVAADFSGITPARGLFLKNVFHDAVIQVNEVGTEAGAATVGVFAVATAAPAVQVKVDRPFFFAVRDTRTGAILFTGRILDPNEGAPAAPQTP